MKKQILPTAFSSIPSLVVGIVVSALGIVGLIFNFPYIRIICAVILFVLLIHCIDMIRINTKKNTTKLKSKSGL